MVIADHNHCRHVNVLIYILDGGKEFADSKRSKYRENRYLVLLNVLIAKVSASRKFSPLKSLTLSASLDLNRRLNRDIRASVNGGAFKICIALTRTL